MYIVHTLIDFKLDIAHYKICCYYCYYKFWQTDTFHNIIRAMAMHEFVNESQVMLILNDISIKPYDTPASVDLTVADIIGTC